MKVARNCRPVDRAMEGYEALGRMHRPGAPLPPERELALQWAVSTSAVNRAAQRLIAAGRLRRTGYKLYPVTHAAVAVTGARYAALSHRADRFPTLATEAAARGVQVEEIHYIGRDALRAGLRSAAERRFDGVIISLSDTGWEWDAEAAQYDRLRIPYVICGEAPPGHNAVAEDVRNGVAQLIAHLADAGHRDIALLTSVRPPHRAAAIRQAYEEICRHLELGESAGRIVEFAALSRDSVRGAVQTVRRDHGVATAVILFLPTVIPFFLAAAKQEGISIPGDLSVVVVGDSPQARAARPALTAAAYDRALTGRLAFDLICHQSLEERRGVRTVGTHRLRIEARLMARSSVAKLATTRRTHAVPTSPSGREFRRWPEDRAARLREAAGTWETPHPLAAGAAPSEFHTIDLQPFANRSFAREHGWLGDLPLLHLAPGSRQVHGVPFQVIDERANAGRSVVVLRSHRAIAQRVTSLPVEVAIRFRHQVRAVYFLHGCGFAGEASPFAWYDFYLAGQQPVSVPLIPRGLRSPSAGGPQPNIQDWWADFPQIAGPGFNHAVLARDGDPYEYERYLYTLEWRNPEPGRTLTGIFLRSNPSSAATLGVLAITLLLA